MTYDVNQKVNFDINFHTGVVSIKCSDCPKWIESEFPKIKSLLENPDDSVEEDTPPPISDPPTPGRAPNSPSVEEGEVSITQQLELPQPNITPPPPSTPPLPPAGTFPAPPPPSSSTDQKAEIKQHKMEIEELWKSVEQIKNAVSNIDRSVNDAVSRIDEARQERSKSLSELDLKISKVELSLDAKVSLFFEETEKSILQKYNNTEKNLANKIWNFKNELKKREEDGRSQESTEALETQHNVVEKELVLWKSGLETSISELKSDFNKIYDECQIDLASFNVVEKKVSSLQQHSQDVSLLLDGLREDVNEQAKQVMQNSSSFHRLADEQMKQKEQLLQHTQHSNKHSSIVKSNS